ncbi:hypothetical protein PV433_29045 [Paenibacillus sp. GYB004]|uniref:hypothetical protein n=1 Tax=Paenibacillus sp. GYB004 TaxID=2994393 RepID=UPI002F965D6D
MEQLRIVRMKSRVSLVVLLRDSFLAAPPSDRKLEVRLANYPRRPVGKPDGTYIFNDLEPGEYELEIDSSYYFRETRLISVGTGNVIVQLPLLPLPSYPYRPSVTLIRAMVTDASGNPVRGALVTAALSSEECVVGRLAEEQTPEGAAEIAVSGLSVPAGCGDTFVLVGRGAKETRETVRILDTIEYQKRFRLERPLEAAYSRGSMLLPVYRTRTTERGEIAVAFPGSAVEAYPASLSVRAQDGEPAVMDVTVRQGVTVSLGTWVLK